MAKTATRVERPEAFYASILKLFLDSGVPFMVGGAYAMREYADLMRDTKDLDVFCTAGDYPRLLRVLAEAGYETEITDANWLSKAFHGEYFVDLIFNSANGLCPVDETWLQHARTVTLFDLEIKLIPPEDEIWQKLYLQDRIRYDGADINHIFRKVGDTLDWHRLLTRMETHWELLFAQIVNFRFVYPAERNVVPRWLMEELVSRVQRQLDLPEPQDRICRGPMVTRTQYQVDITEWGYTYK